MPDQLPARIAEKIEPEPNSGCWLWTAGLTDQGYGSVRWGGRMQKAHRVVHDLLVGPLPAPGPGQPEPDHLCRVRSCVNPRHLEVVSHRTNILRGRGYGYLGLRTHCPSGHPFDAANTYLWRGSRYCRACRAKAQHDLNARRRASAA